MNSRHQTRLSFNQNRSDDRANYRFESVQVGQALLYYKLLTG